MSHGQDVGLVLAIDHESDLIKVLWPGNVDGTWHRIDSVVKAPNT